jgi:plasmid maintenance system antidote protein VapI
MLMGVGTYLIIVLRNVNKLVSQANNLVADNSVSISHTMDLIPELIVNLQETSSSIKDGVERTENVVLGFQETILDTVDTVSASADNVISYLNIILDIIKAISSISIFNKKR